MSTADPAAPPAAGAAPPASAAVAPGRARNPVASWLRLLASELSLTFRRWRNRWLLVAVAAIPVLIGVALRVAAPQGGGGEGPVFLDQVAGNGVFLAFLSLTIMLTLVLPLVVAIVSGDAIAGEAGAGTLRYLLTAPAGRTRLLSVKYLAVAVFGLAACLVVAGASLAVGAALFPVGPVTLLSGATVPLAAGLLRLLLVTLYLAGAMAALAAIGLAISSFTEHGIGAIAALLVLTLASEVADNVPQFASAHPYLPTHWWLSFDGLLRSPVATGDVVHGLVSFGVYAAVFCLIAWARFTSADVTS